MARFMNIVINMVKKTIISLVPLKVSMSYSSRFMSEMMNWI